MTDERHETSKRRPPRGSDGDNLVWEPRLGRWAWRKVHPETKRRLWRDTGQVRRDLARRVAIRFEDELREELAGLPAAGSWRQELLPLVPQWIAAQEIRADSKPQLRAQVERALQDLKLRRAADLRNVAGLDGRLRALERTRGLPRVRLRRAYQDPLRRFTKWLAGNQRHLPEDPLACWEPIPARGRGETSRARRALGPEEVARAFLALAATDARRFAPARPLFLAVLVTGARIESLLERDVEHLDVTAGRIQLGSGQGKKRRGQAALDAATLAELRAAVGDRTAGPLFLSPLGGRWSRWTALDVWRSALSLSFVDALWPEHEPFDLELAVLAERSLRRGRVHASKGGAPRRWRLETVKQVARREAQVQALVDELRDGWAARMEGCDIHALRGTHRTWAAAAEVPAAVIDAQLGHAPGGGEEAGLAPVRALLAGSVTGRRHYLDPRSEVWQPARSAEAVRNLLDAGLARVQAGPPSPLVPGAEG